MSDSDPRPMPPEVQRAYREPVNLRDLLMKRIVYGENDRRDVLDALMRLLVAKYGDVWISAGSKEARVSTRVKQTKKNVVNAIELLSSIEEYGGNEGVLPLLAQAMEPRLASWWESFEWRGWNDVIAWHGAAMHVLGRRQLAWLAAQYTRTVIDLTRSNDRKTALVAIESVEAWARAPSRVTAQALNAAAYAISSAAYSDRGIRSESSASAFAAVRDASAIAVYEGNYIHYAQQNVGQVASAAMAAAAIDVPDFYVTDSEIAAGVPAAYGRLAALTKRLITPTLVTSASRE